MFSFLKYPRIELRRATYPVEPHCTSDSIRTQSNLTVAGYLISFRSPIHWPAIGAGDEIAPVVDAVVKHKPTTIPIDAPSARVECWNYFFRSWAFCGPWFSGVEGDMSLAVQTIRPAKLPLSATLLHPAGFKFAIAEYIESKYTEVSDDGQVACDYTGPHNWSLCTSLLGLRSIFSIRRRNSSTEVLYFVHSLDRDKLVIFCFSMARYVDGSRDDQEKKISFDSFVNLAQEIIDSIEFKFDSSTQRQIDESKALYSEADLAQGLSPFIWGNAEAKLLN